MPLFQYKDPRYTHLFNMILDDINMAVTEISTTRLEASNLIDHALNNNNKRFKRSILPLGGLFSFSFGTADQSDVDSLKADVKQLYCEGARMVVPMLTPFDNSDSPSIVE